SHLHPGKRRSPDAGAGAGLRRYRGMMACGAASSSGRRSRRLPALFEQRPCTIQDEPSAAIETVIAPHNLGEGPPRRAPIGAFAYCLGDGRADRSIGAEADDEVGET